MAIKHPYRQERPIVIKRRRKHEAEQAIKELIDRGFELVHGPVQLYREGKQFSIDSFGRRKFEANTSNGCWAAKLRRVEVNDKRIL